MMRGTRIRVALELGGGARPGKRWNVWPCIEWLEKHGLATRAHGPAIDIWHYQHYPYTPGGPWSLTAKGVADIAQAIAEHEAKGTGWVVSGTPPDYRKPQSRVLFYKVGYSWGETKTRVLD